MNILLVEDDRDLRRFLSKAFREEGYAIAEAESGDQALDRALDGTYSCVILDVMLPGGNGFLYVHHFKRLLPLAQLPQSLDGFRPFWGVSPRKR